MYIFTCIVHCDSANPQLVSTCSFLFVPAMSSHSSSMYCKDSFVQLIASPLSCVALFFELQLLCSSVHSWSGLSCLHHFLLFLCTACSHFFGDSSNMSFSQPCSIVLVLFFFHLFLLLQKRWRLLVVAPVLFRPASSVLLLANFAHLRFELFTHHEVVQRLLDIDVARSL